MRKKGKARNEKTIATATKSKPSLSQNFYVFDGVKPKCTSYFWTDLSYNHIQKSITVRTRPHVDHANSGMETWLLDCKPWTDIEVPLPALFDERIIGKPCCVARKRHIIIAQYITASCKYLRFMLVNLNAGQVELFEDQDHYFHKSFASVWPVECLISPSMDLLIFRLPHIVMSDRKWSKTLQTTIDKTRNGNGTRYTVGDLCESKMLDRRNQAVIFDSRFSKRIVLAEVDQLCRKCKMTIHKDGAISKVKELKLYIHGISSNNCRSDACDEDTSEAYFSKSGSPDLDRMENCQLHHCNISTNRDGCYFLLTFLAVKQCTFDSSLNFPQNRLLLTVVTIDADQLDIVHSKSMFIDEEMKPKDLRSRESVDIILVPMFDKSDSKATIWRLTKGYSPSETKFSINLPRKTSLKALCREALCKSTDLVASLPLPKSLITYLTFENPSFSSTEKEE